MKSGVRQGARVVQVPWGLNNMNASKKRKVLKVGLKDVSG